MVFILEFRSQTSLMLEVTSVETTKDRLTRILFIAWQVIQEEATNIAPSYPEGPTRDKYVAAAKELALPYRDWASASTCDFGLPDILTSQTVNVSPVQVAAYESSSLCFVATSVLLPVHGSMRERSTRI
jgi:hypothetical protein